MLVEHRVHIVEVYLFNVDLVYVLVNRVASSDAHEAVLVQPWVRLVLDTALKVPLLTVSLQIVINRELSLDDSEFKVNGSAIESVHQTVVVGGRCKTKLKLVNYLLERPNQLFILVWIVVVSAFGRKE